MAKTRNNLPDEALVVAAILGDLSSFEVLVMRYRAAAYRVAQSIAGVDLAEDAVRSMRISRRFSGRCPKAVP